ncbi:MAG TPA: pyridoxal phosphate-dependent class II aminotransferase [Thermodesulfobacteriaceae bacterium]|nr:pyridoxal phosphate-dependent class II aminotransferase [Thermodesulfobacteriaceae bacterium]
MLHGHGGDVYSLAKEIGGSPDSILDFSSNVSPLPLPKGLDEVLISRLSEIRCLPEVDSRGVRETLAQRYGMSPDQFLVGSGTTEWIFSLPRILSPGKVIIPLPTYADYADAARLASCEIETAGPWPEAGSGTDQDILGTLSGSASSGSLVFWCNPNNPTGRFISPDLLYRVIKESHETTWVIDESYAPFLGPDHESSLIARGVPSNLVLLRSCSKIYGIPGLRLGYLAGSVALVAELADQARPWSVNRLAQIAGEYLLAGQDYEQEVRDYCMREKQRLLMELECCSFLEPLKGSTHFILFRVHKPWTAAELTRSLRKKSIIIRDCGNFVGLDGEYIRISLRDKAGNDRLVEAIKTLETR